MKYRYITIEREYGSGGSTIGKELSKVCNVPCYGREILETVAQKRGISVERIDQYEEKATGSLMYSLFLMNRVQAGDANMLPGFHCISIFRREDLHRQPHSFLTAVCMS